MLINRVNEQISPEQGLHESQGSHPGLPAPKGTYRLCGRKVTLEDDK